MAIFGKTINKVRSKDQFRKISISKGSNLNPLQWFINLYRDTRIVFIFEHLRKYIYVFELLRKYIYVFSHDFLPS